MSFYDSMASVTLAQIADKGRLVSLVQPVGEPVWNPVTGTMTNANSVAVSLKAVVTDVLASDIDGTLIKAGDRYYLIAAKSVSVDISTDCKVLDGGQEYAVQRVMQTKPADIAILYKLQCRLTGAA